MLRRPILVAALLAVVAAGCAKEASPGVEVETRNETIPMKVSVAVRGGLEITVDERTVPTTFIRIGEGGGANLQPLLGVQPVEPIPEGNLRVLPGFSLTGFTGDGRYVIEPGSPYLRRTAPDAKESGATKRASTVRVEWWPADRGPEEYERVVKPCTVRVDDGGMKGRLTCPDITHEGTTGPNFSLDFRWERA